MRVSANCTSRFTKRASRNLPFKIHKKRCARHEICTSRFTKHCARHENRTSRAKSALRGSQSATPARKPALQGPQRLRLVRNPHSEPCPKHCACHKICASTSNCSDLLRLPRKVDFRPPKHEVYLAPERERTSVKHRPAASVPLQAGTSLLSSASTVA